MTHYTIPGWYGKLPGSGDFVKRRFPDVLYQQWSHWFQVGLHHRHSGEDHTSSRSFLNAPIWNFVVPPMFGSQLIQMGCLAPSCDRVGRHYPLCVVRAFTPTEWSSMQLTSAGDWYRQVGNVLMQVVKNGSAAEQLDQILVTIPQVPVLEDESGQSDILAVIGAGKTTSTLNWQRPGESFDPRFQTSFWWTNQCDGFPLYTQIHSGNFTAQLFSLLFDPAGGATPGRNGLYPPMFEF